MIPVTQSRPAMPAHHKPCPRGCGGTCTRKSTQCANCRVMHPQRSRQAATGKIVNGRVIVPDPPKQNKSAMYNKPLTSPILAAPKVHKPAKIKADPAKLTVTEKRIVRRIQRGPVTFDGLARDFNLPNPKAAVAVIRQKLGVVSNGMIRQAAERYFALAAEGAKVAR